MDTLSVEDRNEYLKRNEALFRSRVGLYCIVTTSLYFAVSLQYLFRKTVLMMDTFRPWELTLWAILLVGTLLCYSLNLQSRSRSASKRIALLYTAFFIWSFSGLAVVYPENNFIFVFYYAFALLFTSVLIPWGLREILWLSVLYAGAFFIAYDYVVRVMKFPSPQLPRFTLPWDGLVFIAIAAFISIVVRRKEMERNVHNFSLMKRVEKQNAQMERELDLARRVHRTLVPDSFSHERADVWVSYIPMSYVSGDYAKFRFLDNDRLLVFISDVTGHGVAAALLVNRVHAEFERLSQEKPDPAALLKKLNEFISRDFEGTNMYLSAFCGLIDFAKGEFRFCNYGHPPQFWYHSGRSEVADLSSHNTLLGILPNTNAAFVQGKFAFEPGDRLLLFTDGVVEASDSVGIPFGENRLREFMKDNSHLRDGRFNETLVEQLTRHSAGDFADDIFILNIQTKAAHWAKEDAAEASKLQALL
jgi:serine phosphatase RsbU (regulator of sigma subunit)